MPAPRAAFLLLAAVAAPLAAQSSPEPGDATRERFGTELGIWLAARASEEESFTRRVHAELGDLAASLCSTNGDGTPQILLDLYEGMSVGQVRLHLAALAEAMDAEAAFRAGDRTTARASLERALLEFTAIGDVNLASRASFFLGLLDEEEARYIGATSRFQGSAEGYARIASVRGEEEALAHLGFSRAMAGADEFEEPLDRAAALASARGDRAAEVGHRLRLGRILLARRDFARADARLRAAIDRTVGGSCEQAELLCLLGQARLEERDFVQAERTLLEAEGLLVGNGETSGPRVAEVRIGLGRVALWRGRFDEAEARAIAAAEAAGQASLALRADALVLRGRARAVRGEKEAARGLFEAAASFARQARNPELEAAALLNEGLAAEEGVPRARDGRRRLMDLAVEGLPARSPVLAALRVAQASQALRAGDPARAEELAREAIEVAEADLLGSPAGPALDFALLPAWGLRAFETAIEATLARSPEREEEAFALAERSKARGFLVELDRYGISIAESAPPPVRETWQRALLRVAHLGTDLQGARDPLGGEVIRSELAAAYEELARATRDVRAACEEEGQVARPATAALVRERLLGGSRLLLEYFVGEESSLLFLVGTEGLRVHRLPGRDELARRVDGFLTVLRRTSLVPQARRKFPEVARALRALLLPEDLSERIRGREVYVVPDGPLSAVPFEALLDGETFLGDSTVFAYGPSSGLLLALAARPLRLGRGLVVAADAGADSGARLPHSEEEALAVAARFTRERTTVLTGADFRKGALLEETREAGVLHLVAHTAIRGDGRIGLRLSPGPAPSDGILWSDEILRVRARPDLVVLSGCETGRGPFVQGLGVRGLVYPFVFGGASRVVVSLWPVEDESVPGLMGAFYDRLLERWAVAGALAEARRTLPHRADSGDVASYAAFVAYGPF
ncbi:MAG TPA: CHAT domain-containing protein [Planctomycetota bacterium]|jgi:hypothetical protein|nr:CHAT domain-containing protein [Planctomycetota bacterium]